MRKLIQKIFNKLGYVITPRFNKQDILMNEEIGDVFKKVKSKVATSTERVYSLYKAIEYIGKAKIEGDFVETGVYAGGSCMVMAYSLQKFKFDKRKIWLYDTYSGMTKPTKEDISYLDNLSANGNKRWEGLYSVPLEEVKENMLSTGYPISKLVFIKGKVEDTLPRHLPKKISLLRIDTDWYQSIKHSIEHLFPLLTKGGVLLLDDYGNWKGARKAIDEYFLDKDIKILLNRIDHTGRIGIK